MGPRVFRYLLGIAILLAFIQILTTLHFSWSQSEQVAERRAINSINRQPLDHKPVDVLNNYKETNRLKSFTEDFVKDILAKYENTKCHVRHKDAKSAASRARSPQCRQIILKTACLNEAKVLYFNNLHRTCPIKDNFHPRSVEEVEPEGPPIRVVFMLTVHGRALRQIKRLLKTIYHKEHYYYFHVDSRSNYLYRNLVELSTLFPNIEVAPWRMATIWGGSSLLQMLLRALDDLIKKPHWEWDFFINLSGSDYPIKSNVDLTEFLRGHRNDNFLKSHGRENAKFIHKQGLDRTFVECDEHMWRIGSRTLPEDIEIDGGSDWIGLNRKFAEYVINSQDTLVTGLKRMYAFALLPAESFFHTVLRNGPHCESFVRSNLRITNWKRKLGCRCQYKHVVDWCGCSPNDFKPGDVGKLKVAKFDLFARKFEAIINQQSINMVDEHMFGASIRDTTALTSYWETFYHHVDDERGLSNAMRTYFASFNRMAARQVTLKYCTNLPVGPTQEVTYLNQDDVFSGLLTLQTVRIPKRDKTIVLETWFKRRDPEKLNVNITDGPRRLKGLQVGTGWDPKERVLRNYGRFMGPLDEPVLVHYWHKGSPVFNVKLMWVDPIGVLAGVFEMRVEEDWVVSYHKPQFHKPLRPGTWTIKLVYREPGGSDMVIGHTQFLIIPLAYKSTAQLRTEDSVSANSGPISGRYSTEYSIDFDRSLSNLNELARKATANSKKTGQELHDWIDELVSGYWHVEDACVVGEIVSGCPELKACEKTTWSTRSPDPKSDLSGISRDVLS